MRRRGREPGREMGGKRERNGGGGVITQIIEIGRRSPLILQNRIRSIKPGLK